MEGEHEERIPLEDDIAFRAHFEHPDWNAERLSEEADHELDRFPIEDVQYTDQVNLE